MTRSAVDVVFGALRRHPPGWALAALVELPVVELAEACGILPILADVAVQHGLIPELDAPTILADRRSAMSPAAVLLAAREQNRARHADLDAIRATAVRELGRAGAGFRHLKGGALRSAGVWRDFSARPTRDVDILVADSLAIAGVESSLLALGFEHSDEVETSRAWDDDHHDRPLVLPGRAGSLELHAAPLVRRHRARITLDMPEAAAEPDLIATLRHIITHAQLQDEAILQFRLPFVPILDVAFALEAGLVRPSQLLDGVEDRLARRAIRLHLGSVDRLRGETIPGGRISGLRWSIGRALISRPRLAQLIREAVFAPRALSRQVMEAREGRSLSVLQLATARGRFLRERVPRGMRSVADGDDRARTIPAERRMEEDIPVAPADAPAPDPNNGADPARLDGFEAVWSSNGLVLVDLSTDVLHHLNSPAAVVYELVGGRTVVEIVDAYAALAETDIDSASSAVESALDGLAEIGAVSGRPLRF